MYKFKDFLLGMNPFSGATLGISIAASWAWGVSIVVGIQVFQGKGLTAFLIWAAANSLALVLCGYAMSKVPVSVLRLPEIIPGRLKVVYDVLTMLIQFFSLLVNIVAIKTAFGMLQIGGLWWLLLCGTIFLAVLARGFDVTVRNNLLFFGLWITLLVIAVLSRIGDSFVVAVSSPRQIQWGLYGALILFCAPILDQQMWQHRAACRGNVKPFCLASGLFGVYMALVALVAALGASTNLLVALVILMVAGTTLVSALSAISTFFGRFVTARVSMFGMFALAAACAIFNVTVLQWWTAYGTLRIPFAVAAFGVIAWKTKKEII